MEKPKRSPWVPFLIGGCVLTLLCLCAGLLAGGTAFFIFNSDGKLPEKLEFNLDMGQEETLTVEPTIEKPTIIRPSQVETTEIKPTNEKPTPAKPAIVVSPTAKPDVENQPDQDKPSAEQTLTGKQRTDDHSIFDDFSSNGLLWPIVDDGKTILRLENGLYTISIVEPDYLDWAYFPVEFIPYEISFDAKGPAGQQNGTFGVYCHYLDFDNKYYVEFDLASNEYVISEVLAGDVIPLTKQNSKGQYWQPAKGLKTPPTSSNHYTISCYLDSITLFINDKLVDQVEINEPLDEPGTGAFFVYTYPFADENGYSVFLDNVEIFQPVQ